MFTIDAKITERDLQKKNLIKVLHSMNIHQVATPETSLEDARSYVFIAREGKNKLSAYVGLHLLHTDRKLFYAYSANPFLAEELRDVEEEARYFAEDLNAMLDEVDFENLSDLEKNSWIKSQSIFSRKKQPEAAPVEQPPLPAEPAAAATVPPPALTQQVAAAVEEMPAPEPPAEPIPSEPVDQAQQSEAEEPRPPQEVHEDAQVRQVKDSPLAAAKRRQEVQQNTAADDPEKSPKQTATKKVFSATGVVSRDREALARLLTSF